MARMPVPRMLMARMLVAPMPEGGQRATPVSEGEPGGLKHAAAEPASSISLPDALTGAQDAAEPLAAPTGLADAEGP